MFPKGKHDDQADSTAQFLDWYKKPGPHDGYFAWLQEQAERKQKPENDRTRVRVLLKEQPDMRVQSIQTFSNRHLDVPPDRMIEVSAEDADSLIRQGWQKLGELPKDELPGDPDEYFKPINEPQGPKVNYAVGSMECQAQIKKERAAREAAEKVREQMRLARVAALLERRSQHAAE